MRAPSCATAGLLTAATKKQNIKPALATYLDAAMRWTRTCPIGPAAAKASQDAPARRTGRQGPGTRGPSRGCRRADRALRRTVPGTLQPRTGAPTFGPHGERSPGDVQLPRRRPSRRYELASRARHPPGGGEPKSLGWQPHRPGWPCSRDDNERHAHRRPTWRRCHRLPRLPGRVGQTRASQSCSATDPQYISAQEAHGLLTSLDSRTMR